MDLVAGNLREILLAITLEDGDGLGARGHFDAHLSLGAGLDPAWLDQFSAAARAVTGSATPSDFSHARWTLDGPGDVGDRTVEGVDSAWVGAVARLTDRQVDAVAGRWIDLIAGSRGPLAADEKPAIRELASDLIAFARAADGSPAVLFAWSL